MITKIISGGQSGADIAGLKAARYLGLDTGGWIPLGYRTDEGPKKDLAFYNLKQTETESYVPRTRRNVKDAHGTVIFGDLTSPGCRLTVSACAHYQSPYFAVPNETLNDSIKRGESIFAFKRWIEFNEINVINIAGNRERINPGIEKKVYDYLIEAFQK